MLVLKAILIPLIRLSLMSMVNREPMAGSILEEISPSSIVQPHILPKGSVGRVCMMRLIVPTFSQLFGSCCYTRTLSIDIGVAKSRNISLKKVFNG